MLPRANRVRSTAEFDQVFTEGALHRGKLLSIRSVAALADTKLGVIVGKRVDIRATRRNRLKRQVRATFRVIAAELTRPVWVVVIVQPAARAAKPEELGAELRKLLRHAKLIP